MKKYLLFIILLFLTTSCNAQNKIDRKTEHENTIEPKENIIVNKEYDENGNLIRFDSTYSYFYSNLDSNSTLEGNAFKYFQEDFFNSFPNIQKPLLDDMFFEDSLLTYDFYKNDFFSKRFEMNWEKYNDIFKEMDSIKNKFYDDYMKNKNGKNKKH